MDVTSCLRQHRGRRALFERAPVAAALALVVTLVAPRARAESTTDPKVEPAKAGAGATNPAVSPASQRPATEPKVGVADEALSRIIDRPHTIAEIELGIVALPTAPISAGQSGGDTPFGTIGRGDATMQTGLHVLYRFHRNFAVGAGALFSPFPTSDPEYGGQRQLPRTHSRGYFFFGGEGRWVPLHWKFFEGWVGVSIGGVVVADRFNTDAGDKVAPILGTKEVTVRTEGFAAGLQLGGTYYISENWIAGTMFRAYRWVLPDTPRCSSIGDCGTLSGSITALEFGITIGYRLPL